MPPIRTSEPPWRGANDTSTRLIPEARLGGRREAVPVAAHRLQDEVGLEVELLGHGPHELSVQRVRADQVGQNCSLTPSMNTATPGTIPRSRRLLSSHASWLEP